MTTPCSAEQAGRCHDVDEQPIIRAGTTGDVPTIKAIADRERHALGFVHRGSLMRAITRNELIVADVGQSVGGFCHFYRRRDGIVTLYHITVDPELRCKGIGRAMLIHLHREAIESGMITMRLKCPADLPANEFYARYGFRLVEVEGKKARPLNVWALRLRQEQVGACHYSAHFDRPAFIRSGAAATMAQLGDAVLVGDQSPSLPRSKA